MTKKIKVSKLSEFDAVEYLNSEEEVTAVYLMIVLEENNSALLAAASGDIARARRVSQVAKDSSIAREALYKGALQPPAANRSLRRSATFALPWTCVWWRSRYIQHTDGTFRGSGLEPLIRLDFFGDHNP